MKSGKWIVGYHGALASWVDFKLLKNIAADGRYQLLLIGHEHDQNMRESGILDMENVLFLGAKPYRELNRYAAFYDIAILPFQINNLTLSVSPVKIFEYMALEKPVVTYALPECRKYKSCLCARTSEEFMEKLEQAVQLKDDAAYKTQLRTDAQNNTWDEVTRKTVELVKNITEVNLQRPFSILHIHKKRSEHMYPKFCGFRNGNVTEAFGILLKLHL